MGMRAALTETVLIIHDALRVPSSLVTGAVVSLGFFVLAVLLPVATITGNSVPFQLSIYAGRDFVLLTILSLLAGLHGALMARSWQQRRSRLALSGAASGASGLFAAIVGTAACSSCIASLFGLLGLGAGSVLFVLQYRALFLAAAVAIMLVSLYLTARSARACCSATSGCG